MIKVCLEFDAFWILTRQDDDALPVDKFMSAIADTYQIELLDTGFTECAFIIKNDDANCENVLKKITDMIMGMYPLKSLSEAVKVTVTDYNDEMDDAKLQKQKEVEKTLQKINQLVGAEEFKALANEIVKVAPGLIKYNAVDSFTHQCYLFSINEGYGVSTYLKLFAELVDKLELVTLATDYAIAEKKVVYPQGREPSNPFGDVYNELLRRRGEAARIVCIDISEWMSKLNEKRFRDFLSIVSRHLGNSIIIFKVPFVEHEVLKGIKRSIEDILCVRDISFVPFDTDELRECAVDIFDKKGFKVHDDVWPLFDAKVTEEKNDGRFYGINTINKIVREMIYCKTLDNAVNGIDDTELKASELSSLVKLSEGDNRPGLELLDEYIGMQEVKARVEEIVAQIEVATKNQSLGAPCIHMRFVGNPGTGKTTVARLVGKVLKEKGILRNGNFFEYTGRDFCGQFIGETAPKTAGICRDAYGSVLFIDEAYSLYRGGHDSKDFGREAIETLIAEMENHRSDLVVIMAGYPEEMKTLMGANPGLESRMPYIVEFPNYTREQLFDIFMLMVNKTFKCGEGFEEAAKTYFDELPDDVVLSKEFSNARFVRNLFERTWGKAVLRCQLSKQECTMLTKEDFLLSSSEKEFKKIMSKPKRSLGFV
ncbi:MAG: AAA family ATPase [Clostridia bacterium]|nr:AAA family ATPase [Clostridia bacterium]